MGKCKIKAIQMLYLQLAKLKLNRKHTEAAMRTRSLLLVSL